MANRKTKDSSFSGK